MANTTYFGAPLQPDNPIADERHALAKFVLEQKGRLSDFDYITRLTSPPPDITNIARPGEFRDIHIGIIGAGLAGLAAGFELRKLGFDITIFDALEDRIGGRVYTYYFNREKTLYGELGPARIPVTHETVWHYINLFRLNTRPFILTNENAFIYLRNMRVRNDPQGINVMQQIYPKYQLSLQERSMSWQQLTYYGFENPLLNASPEARSEILQVKPAYNPFILYWDANSNRSILENAGLSQDAINLLQNFSPLAGENMYNSYLDYIEETYTVDLSYLYEIPGGLTNLPLAFYDSLKSRYPEMVYPGIPSEVLGRILWRRGHWVEGISYRGEDGRVTLTFSSKNSEGKKQEHFDYVICAIPFSTLRNVKIDPVFGSTKMQAIKEVDYINAQKSMLLCRRRFWEEGGPTEQICGGISYTDQPITQIIYPSDRAKNCVKNVKCFPGGTPSYYLYHPGGHYHPSRESGVLWASYNFNLDATRLGNMSEGLRLEEIKREVERVHGLPVGYLNPIVADMKTINWNNEKWFRGALCFYTPEQKRLFSYASALPEYNNKVFFAGEHISAKHRWMQGALKSGMEAANALAIECRKRK